MVHQNTRHRVSVGVVFFFFFVPERCASLDEVGGNHAIDRDVVTLRRFSIVAGGVQAACTWQSCNPIRVGTRAAFLEGNDTSRFRFAKKKKEQKPWTSRTRYTGARWCNWGGEKRWRFSLTLTLTWKVVDARLGVKFPAADEPVFFLCGDTLCSRLGMLRQISKISLNPSKILNSFGKSAEARPG